jgi:hypothetical protein
MLYAGVAYEQQLEDSQNSIFSDRLMQASATCYMLLLLLLRLLVAVACVPCCLLLCLPCHPRHAPNRVLQPLHI